MSPLTQGERPSWPAVPEMLHSLPLHSTTTAELGDAHVIGLTQLVVSSFPPAHSPHTVHVYSGVCVRLQNQHRVPSFKSSQDNAHPFFSPSLAGGRFSTEHLDGMT